MSLGKRHIGRRVVGVGAGVALMMLGLAAPASAAPPTVASIAPTSGPVDCIAVVTGTFFTDSPVGDTDVTFDGAVDVPATDIAIGSATELWVRVPGALVEGSSYTILVENNGGSASGGTFTATTGGCAPTITSFLPTCGLSATTVVITGTNLLGGTDPTVGADQAEVRFFDYVAGNTEADHIVPNADSSTSISVLVPSGAADGPIRVQTDVATMGFSAAPFLVPPPDCVPATTPEHARAITFKLKKSGKASGVLSSTEDPAFTDCVASVPVKIQKKKKGDGWKTKATATTTDTGSYSANVNAKPGKWRAVAPKVELGTPTVTDVCLKAKSAIRKIG